MGNLIVAGARKRIASCSCLILNECGIGCRANGTVGTTGRDSSYRGIGALGGSSPRPRPLGRRSPSRDAAAGESGARGEMGSPGSISLSDPESSGVRGDQLLSAHTFLLHYFLGSRPSDWFVRLSVKVTIYLKTLISETKLQSKLKL